MKPLIVGAGLSGLIAAHAFPSLEVHEARRQAPLHRALLRFRTDAISQLTQVPFRKVRVRKGIVLEDHHVGPNIRLANMYSRKVLGEVVNDRSIWNLEECDRYVAPNDFAERLFSNVQQRVRFNSPVSYEEDRAYISTAPLPIVLKILYDHKPTIFQKRRIIVEQYDVEGVDVFQTLYYPGNETPIYRASFTGSRLIIEYVDWESWFTEIDDVLGDFGLDGMEYRRVDKTTQHYGKIKDIPDLDRKRLLARLTRERRIYSLGRFATWRNILLDDLVNDISVIRALMEAGDYEREKLAL